MESCKPPPLIHMKRSPDSLSSPESNGPAIKQESAHWLGYELLSSPAYSAPSNDDFKAPPTLGEDSITHRHGWSIAYQPVLVSPCGEVSNLHRALNHEYGNIGPFLGLSHQQSETMYGVRPDLFQSYWHIFNVMLRKARSCFGYEETGEKVLPTDEISTEQNRAPMDPTSPRNHIETKLSFANSATVVKNYHEPHDKKIAGSNGPAATPEPDRPLQHEQKKQRKHSDESKPFKCRHCKASYHKQFELNRHFKVSHVKPHKCPICNGEFGHRNYLRVHIETVHEKKKRHGCHICGKFLSTAGNLSVHIRTIHMKERKFTCTVCSKSFGQQCNMKTHMRRHQINIQGRLTTSK